MLENVVDIVRVVVAHQNYLLLDVLIFLRISCPGKVLTAQRGVLFHARDTFCLASFGAVQLLLKHFKIVVLGL